MNIFQLERTLPGRLRYSEIFEITDQILQLSTHVVGTDPKAGESVLYPAIRSLVADLHRANSDLGTALGQDKGGSPFTELRARHDEDRDSSFVQLVRRTRLTLDDDLEDPSLREAAAVIQSVLDDHPADLHRFSDAENTAELKILLPKLREFEAATALEQLGLSRYVDRLERANNGFSDVVEEAARAARDRADSPTATEAVRPVRWLASTLLQFLNYGAFQQDESLVQLVQEIEAVVKKVRANSLARQTRSTSEREVEAAGAQSRETAIVE